MIAGKGAHGYIGAQLIAGLYNVTFRVNTVELDNATGATGGYENPEAGLLGGTLSIRGWYDVGLSRVSPVLAGQTVEQVFIYLTLDETTPHVLIPLGLVTESETGAEVRGKIDFSCTIKTKFGEWQVAECVIAP